MIMWDETKTKVYCLDSKCRSDCDELFSNKITMWPCILQTYSEASCKGVQLYKYGKADRTLIREQKDK